MMEIYGTIHFKLILPHYPRLSAGAAAGACLQPLPGVQRTALIPATAFSAGARTGPACGARMNKINEIRRTTIK